MIRPEEAIARLLEGSRRFAESDDSWRDDEPVDDSAPGQTPFAVVIGCSDSRVPLEIVLGQGPGDLFVIRVAGNVVYPSQIGSVEFGTDQLGARLVLVLGHSECGAVSAAIAQMDDPPPTLSPNLQTIVDRVRSSLEPLRDSSLERGSPEFHARAVRLNVQESVDRLLRKSAILRRLIAEEGLVVMGGRYSIETGCLELFDEQSD